MRIELDLPLPIRPMQSNNPSPVVTQMFMFLDEVLIYPFPLSGKLTIISINNV